jgi:hypothetical protein
MPRALRDRRQAGRLELDGDPVHRQLPVRGAARTERGVGGCCAAAGLRDLLDPARHRPSGPTLPPGSQPRTADQPHPPAAPCPFPAPSMKHLDWRGRLTDCLCAVPKGL